jgi:hypothetical protein
VPSDRTTVTELGTGLGMLGLADIDTAVRSRTSVMHSVSPEMWERLDGLRSGGAFDTEFHAAWANGQAFLAAGEGLRGRHPVVVEWKGTGRAPGDEVAPIDLRVDHVYLVSCKYLSNILFNASPAHVFDSLLVTGPGRAGRSAREVLPGGGDWYAEVAPAAYQALYGAVRDAVAATRSGDAGADAGAGAGADAGVGSGAAMPRAARAHTPGSAGPGGRRGGRDRGAVALPGLDDGDAASDGASGTTRSAGLGPSTAAPRALDDLPARAVDLTSLQRDALGTWLKPGWPEKTKELYVALSDEVARASVRRWEAALAVGGGSGEAMLWRLLRIGSAPYFVLGSSSARSLRLRIATSWDWRQHFTLMSLTLEPQSGGQPRVGWDALVRDRVTHHVHEVAGHIEVRWSHGRFGGLPEAKGYLDTPHHAVPGYFPLR